MAAVFAAAETGERIFWMSGTSEILKGIPKVEKVLAWAKADPELAYLSRYRLLEAVRQELAGLRQDLLAGRQSSIPSEETLVRLVKQRAIDSHNPRLQPAINATGVILHTNLGRAPLAATALEQVLQVAGGYSTLEYDPETGRRSDRLNPVEELLKGLTGAEAATVANNNAAAIFLLMVTLGQGRSVAISRGELVEIGGSFRLPDIIEASGVAIKEVGSTNRTLLADYQKALNDGNVAAILKVHASNFRQIGYTAQCTVPELAALAKSAGLPLVVDLGSGALFDLTPLGLVGEDPIQKPLSEGADAVCFSGDKLLGGAQAGIIIGRSSVVEPIKSHPLARTVRPDKMTLAALEATLCLAQDPQETRLAIPVNRMLYLPDQELHQLANRLKRVLGSQPGLRLTVMRVNSQTGGGAAPEQPLSSWAVAVESPGGLINRLEERLRLHRPPVVARIWHDRLLLDVRTIFPDQFPILKQALTQARLGLADPL
jgi:L-seryl-tRNA(Ser) seleniumtransferase